MQAVDEGGPIRCALLVDPARPGGRKLGVLRSLVLAIAFVAVVLLLAIALYYIGA